MGNRIWRSRWAPRWLKRMFPGRWTQAEVDAIERRAEKRYGLFLELTEPDPTPERRAEAQRAEDK